MPTIAIEIVKYVLMFADKIPALIAAGVDFQDAWQAHKAKANELAAADQRPSPQDWVECNARLDTLEADILSAHQEK